MGPGNDDDVDPAEPGDDDNRRLQTLTRESSDVLQPRDFVEAVETAKRPLQFISLLGVLAGIIFAGLGVWLVVGASESGTTSISLFGQEVETTSVGVACIFIGAVTVIVTIRRVLKSLDIVLRR
jgi:hypothetical protein